MIDLKTYWLSQLFFKDWIDSVGANDKWLKKVAANRPLNKYEFEKEEIKNAFTSFQNKNPEDKIKFLKQYKITHIVINKNISTFDLSKIIRNSNTQIEFSKTTDDFEIWKVN